MTMILVGNREGPADVVSADLSLFRAYLSALSSDDPIQVYECLSRAYRRSRRLRQDRGLISRSNWNEYTAPETRLRYAGNDPVRSQARRANGSRGSRAKELSWEDPFLPLLQWPDYGLPLAAPPNGWVRSTGSILYQTGPVDEFHTCSQVRSFSIERTSPTMGEIYTGSLRFQDFVHVPYARPGYKDSGYFSVNWSLDPDVQKIRRASWPVVDVPLAQADVEYARRDALASMYGGTPPTNPNFLRALCELKDARQTIRGLVHFFKWGQEALSRGAVWEKVGGSIRRVGGVRTARLTIRELAQAYLTYVFGIMPTWQDLITFLRHISVSARDIINIPQGGAGANPGVVITSHYHVESDWRSKWNTGVLRSSASYSPITDFSASDFTFDVGAFHGKGLGYRTNTSRNYPDVLYDRLDGCVFARLRQDASEYFWRNFGHVGWTWSYPPITTLWELVPWSWLVDWFANCRRSIRLAEREARTYWMRAGFEEPWLSERVTRRRRIHDIQHWVTPKASGLAWYWEWHGYVTSVTVKTTTRFLDGGSVPVSLTYSRGPYGSAGWVSHPTERAIRVRAFQISTGMALVLST